MRVDMDKENIRFGELKGILSEKIEAAASTKASDRVKARLDSYKKRFDVIEGMEDGPNKAAAIARLVDDLRGL
jgi:hypothetical protein